MPTQDKMADCSRYIPSDFSKVAKNRSTCFRLPIAMDMFPRTDRSKDINAILSSHVECVIGLRRKESL